MFIQNLVHTTLFLFLDLLQGPRRPGVFCVGRSVSEVSCLKADQPDGKLHGQLQLRGADVRRERSAVGPPADHRARGGVQSDVPPGEQRQHGRAVRSQRHLAEAGAGAVVSISVFNFELVPSLGKKVAKRRFFDHESFNARFSLNWKLRKTSFE